MRERERKNEWEDTSSWEEMLHRLVTQIQYFNHYHFTYIVHYFIISVYRPLSTSCFIMFVFLTHLHVFFYWAFEIELGNGGCLVVHVGFPFHWFCYNSGYSGSATFDTLWKTTFVGVISYLKKKEKKLAADIVLLIVARDHELLSRNCNECPGSEPKHSKYVWTVPESCPNWSFIVGVDKLQTLMTIVVIICTLSPPLCCLCIQCIVHYCHSTVNQVDHSVIIWTVHFGIDMVGILWHVSQINHELPPCLQD